MKMIVQETDDPSCQIPCLYYVLHYNMMIRAVYDYDLFLYGYKEVIWQPGSFAGRSSFRLCLDAVNTQQIESLKEDDWERQSDMPLADKCGEPHA